MNYLRVATPYARRPGCRNWQIRKSLTLWCEVWSFAGLDGQRRVERRWWTSIYVCGVFVYGAVHRDDVRKLLAARYGKRAAKRRVSA